MDNCLNTWDESIIPKAIITNEAWITNLLRHNEKEKERTRESSERIEESRGSAYTQEHQEQA